MFPIIGANSKKRILAVDDTAIILTRISNTLRDDYEVITVNSGVRALKYLEQEMVETIHSTEPSLETVFMELTGRGLE